MLKINKNVLLLFSFLCITYFFESCDKPDDGSSTPEQITVSVQELSLLEGEENTNAFIRIQLSDKSDELITAYISSVDRTAIAGEDYFGFENIPIVFEPGDQYKDYQITIIGDEEFEEDEQFDVIFANIEGFAFPAAGVTSITIENDEASPYILNIPEEGYSTPMSYEGMELIWQDEFDQEAVDENFWCFEIGHGNNGWGNNELQYYQKQNASIVDGNLVIEAKKNNSGSQYTSSRMITKGKFDFQYGRVDIRAVLPEGQGIWPALWMLGANIDQVSWPACGEIDIMELIGHQPNRVYGTAHWSSSGQHASFGSNTSLSNGIFKDEFHVFSIIWDENQIRWLMDDVQYHALTISSSDLSELRNNQFFIFNVAVGGNWPGNPNPTTIFPQFMVVDYIRVFQ